ncbi:MAG: zf-HC2 domain-containing protein [Pseudomonadota bacterium]
MNCKQCSELLIDYNRNELPAHESAQVANHLPGCTSCSAELGRLHELDTLLDRAEQPSAGLQKNFEARLAAEITKLSQTPSTSSRKIQPRAGLFHTLWPSRPFAAVCYSFALLTCGLVSGQLLPPSLGFANDYSFQVDEQGNQLQTCSVPARANNNIL